MGGRPLIASPELRALVPDFAHLPPPTIDRLAALAGERRYRTNAVLYRAGDAADGLYIILSGRVRVSRVTRTRIEMLHREEPGGILGEIPAFGGGPFPASAIAIEPTRCAHLPLDAVERLLQEEPAFARFALRRLATRARSLIHRIDELTTTTITSRVAEHLLRRSGGAERAEFTLGMSQEALATDLGTAREVVVRALRTLIAEGAVTRAGRSRYVVSRAVTLRTIASGAR